MVTLTELFHCGKVSLKQLNYLYMEPRCLARTNMISGVRRAFRVESHRDRISLKT